MATFDGVTFEERGRGNGAFLPAHGFKTRYAILPMPSGAGIYLQLLSFDSTSLDIPARVTAAQLASLRSKVNKQGTLVYTGGTLTAAGYSLTLQEVADVQEIKRDVDMYFCTLKFLLW